MFACRPSFSCLRWFQLFCFFYLVSAVCLPDKGSHFSFATNICCLVFISLPQAFVVCSFFFFLFQAFVYSFFSYTSFSAGGIRARLSAFAFFLS